MTDSSEQKEDTQTARVEIEPGDDATTIKKKLDLTESKVLLLILTGTSTIDQLDKRRRARLAELFRRGVIQAAVDRKAAILDNGTRTGVVALLGQCAADCDLKTPLIGIAPADSVSVAAVAKDSGKVRLDPHHKTMILPGGADWNTASETLFDIVEKLDSDLPVVAIAAGDAAPHDVLHCACHRWPVIVVEESGGTAAQLAKLINQKRGIDRRRPRDKDRWWRRLRWILGRRELGTDDANLREAVLDGKLVLLKTRSTSNQLKEAIGEQVQAIRAQRASRAGDENTKLLVEAWRQFALYDFNAARQQTYFYRLRGWPLFLGVLITILTISYTALKTILGNPLPEYFLPVRLAFDLSIIALPIVVSVLLAADTRFKAINKWTLLRSTAEGFKREIYRFRFKEKLLETISAKTDEERKQQKATLAKYRSQLQQTNEDVTRRMMRTDVNESALHPYHGPLPPKMYGAAAEDDGFTPLDAGQYIDIRIGDQLGYYQKKTNEFEKQIRWYRWWILIYGGLGSLLVAARVEFLVPITAAIVGALAAYLEYRGIEVSLRKYNQTATNLENIRNKWLSYTKDQQEVINNLEWLLETTERVLEYEFAGWVQQMQDIVAGPDEQTKPEADKRDEAKDKGTKGAEDAGEVKLSQDTKATEGETERHDS